MNSTINLNIGDDLELTVNPTNGRFVFDYDGGEIIVLSEAPFVLTTDRCPDPSAHHPKPSLLERLLRRFSKPEDA